MSSTSHVADAVAAADFFAAAGFEWAAAWPALAYTGSHVDLGTFLIIGRGDRGCGRLRRGRSGGVLRVKTSPPRAEWGGTIIYAA